MGKVEFDMTAIEAWADNIENMLESELEDFLLKAINVLSTQFVLKVQDRTPVGNHDNDYVEFTTNPREKTKEVYFSTKDGRDVFFIAKNPPKAVKFKNTLAGKSGKTLRESWDIKKIQRESDGITVVIFNSKDYASHVEYGHIIRSKKGGPAKGFVKGKHMLQHTEIEMTFVGQEILEKAYNDFLKKVLE